MKAEEFRATAPDSHAIWVFTPSRTDPRDLEAIFVQRHELLADAVERVRESTLTGHKHHLLFVGPRGCGKTHLITLLVNRSLADDSLADRLRIAWLNEDETCTSLLDLLIKIHTALEKRYPGDFDPEQLAAAYDLKPDAALEFVSARLLDALGERTLLVVMENLDSIFDSLGDSGQKQLRAFIQENPRFSLVATAQRLVDELSDRGSPFFGFFQTEHLKTLTVEQAAELLGNIARIQKKNDVAEFLTTSRGRSRVRALHHLSGGNHRIYIVLSQFITRESIGTLVGPFMKMVDELTPYYQERLRWLSPLQRKIVEFLCTCETTVPVKEIARRLFASQATISSQLQILREKGYVDSNQRGREFLYEISEPLMRICVEVKDSQNAQPIRLLVDFLRVWYEDDDLKKRQQVAEPASMTRTYVEAAIQRNVAEGNLRKRIFLQELNKSIPDSVAIEDKALMMKMASDLPEEGILALDCVIRGDPDGERDVFNEATEIASDPTIEAKFLISRGRLNGLRGDDMAQLADYTQVIELPGVPVDQVAMALNNRGVSLGQAGDLAAALADYTRVIELPGAPVDQVARALNNRGITHDQAGDLAAALADYTRVIELPGAPVDQVARALFNRGIRHGQTGDLTAALADYTRVIELPEAPVDQVAWALNNRGITHDQAGDLAAALADYTRVIELPGAPVDQVARALFNRGIRHGQTGGLTAALADYTRVIELPEAPVDQVAWALYIRGISHGRSGDLAAALGDYTRVIELPGAPVDQVSRALYIRGITHDRASDLAAALADYTRVIELPEAPVDLVARALNNRGLSHGQAGDLAAALADFTRVIELPGAPVDQVSRALYIRGITHDRASDLAAALADYTRVIELPEAPVDLVARALNNRGLSHGQAGDLAAALADFTRVIELPGAPVDQVAWALINRGDGHDQAGELAAALADYTRVIELPGAPVDQVASALNNRGDCHDQEGDLAAALADYTRVIELPGAPVDQVAWALISRGAAHLSENSIDESISAFERTCELPGSPNECISLASFCLSVLFVTQGNWQLAMHWLEKGLELQTQDPSVEFQDATDLIGAWFDQGGSPEIRRARTVELIHLFSNYGGLPFLGDFLIRHLGGIYQSGDPYPHADNLEDWASAWEQAGADVPELQLPLRLLRVGIEFLKSKGENRGILLDLTAPERAILEQAFGLE